MKYLLIPLFVQFVFFGEAWGQSLVNSANKLSEQMQTLGMAVALGALAYVGICMMAGKKDSGVMATQAAGGIAILVLGGSILGFIKNLG